MPAPNYASLGVRREVLNQLRKMSRLESRPIATIVALAVADRLKGYPAPHRALVAVTATEEAR